MKKKFKTPYEKEYYRQVKLMRRKMRNANLKIMKLFEITARKYCITLDELIIQTLRFF